MTTASGADSATDGAGMSDGPHGTDELRGRRRPRIAVARSSLLVAAAFVALDQITKDWAITNLADRVEPTHVIGTLQWNLAFNSGMAFSRGRGLGPFIGVLAFVVVVGLVVSSARVESRLGRVASGMLIGGALGNLLDRAFRGDGLLNGSVIDFIDVQWWPIFNVADVGVTVGAVLFMASSLLASRSRS